MITLIFESLLVGFITLLVGHMAFNLTVNKRNKDQKIKPIGINIAFFITGFLIHLVFEYIGFNKMYCDKRCRSTINILSK
jgi:hypothetical protein